MTGVPPADQARIFDRFRRGTSAYRTYRGSGLGLSIVRAIAEAHGGRVELVSAPGAGSTFTLVLPAGWAAGASHDARPAVRPLTGVPDVTGPTVDKDSLIIS